MTRTMTERMRVTVDAVRTRLAADGWQLGPVDADGNASGGFVDGCDAYEGYAFVADRDGRSYYVTVEDVTIASDS